MTSDEEVIYTGITRNLQRRWSPLGYSRIHPRNCYLGGQSTHCKINSGILRETLAGHVLRLWVREHDTQRP